MSYDHDSNGRHKRSEATRRYIHREELFSENILKCMAWFASSCLPLIHAVKSKFANARICYDSSLSVVRCQITSAVHMAAVHMASRA